MSSQLVKWFVLSLFVTNSVTGLLGGNGIFYPGPRLIFVSPAYLLSQLTKPQTHHLPAYGGYPYPPFVGGGVGYYPQFGSNFNLPIGTQPLFPATAATARPAVPAAPVATTNRPAVPPASGAFPAAGQPAFPGQQFVGVPQFPAGTPIRFPGLG